MNVNLAFITDPMRKSIFVYGLGPLRDFLIWLPWPVLMLGVAYLAWRVAGWRIALLSLFGLAFIGVTGMWIPTMVTVSQVSVALVLSVVIAVPIGIVASRSDGFEAFIRPILDAMQTLPAFVYLPIVIMLFKIGEVSGIIATVIYAMPPAVRLTNLGIRQVSAEVIEAARSYGSTPRQILFKVQWPLALPTIMMGINQTTMMALAMVIYAALIGARGLGAEVLVSIGRFDVGAGFEAGMSIVFLAIIADRITQGWAKTRQRALEVATSQ
jgi:glycine betaine/proline transport system permease protein